MAAVVARQRPVRARGHDRRQIVLAIVVLVLGALGAWYADANLNGYRQQLFILCAIYAVVAVALALTSGFTGVFSLGQIGFLAIGAYVSALLSMPPAGKQPMLLPGLPEWLATFDSSGWHPQAALLFASLVGGLAAALIGALVGAPLMRLSGNYVAVATMGFLIIVHSVAVNWDDVTRGARGLSQIPTSTNPWAAYVWAAIAVYVALRLRNSPYGRAMIASRENIIASRSVGVNVLRTRLLAFVVSAFLTGVAGSLLAHQIGTVAPSGFYFATTFTVVIMVVLGGMGSISGAVVGAIIMTLTPELLRPIEDGVSLGPLEFGALYGLSNIIIAIGFILVMIFRPQGLLGDRELGLALLGRRTPQQDASGEDIAITPELVSAADAANPDSRG
ncbi:MAG: branched-chain amino acid ABC transporter permease [Chloroflexota bacterium]|nr:branched-chain amino acid ABC transporter permease [Chloroflexia bacterium]MDQ3226950.1 branched-chain amino acid ABC transporter permease [Chloroflexota bacterium]